MIARNTHTRVYTKALVQRDIQQTVAAVVGPYHLIRVSIVILQGALQKSQQVYIYYVFESWQMNCYTVTYTHTYL